ncbi:MAG: EVE domain-containing protein [Gemmatimonadetes bacterium]|nr:EVE domain-containing protein [Gemmatimonadota bacterium]
MWAHVFTPRAAGERRYWLVKSEPEVFSWSDLESAPGRTTHWDGIRNFAARNFMLDGMRVGDLVFFYHSMANPQVIAGIAEVVREAYPDFTQFDHGHHGFDADSPAEAPTWWMVDLRAVAPLQRPVSLNEIKATPALANMTLLRIGRLSVTPVTPDEWATIVALSERPAPIDVPAAKPAPKVKRVAAAKPKSKAQAKPKPQTKPKSKAKPVKAVKKSAAKKAASKPSASRSRTKATPASRTRSRTKKK